MNLQSLYSLAVGQKITKPFIAEKYFPLPFLNKYVTFQPWSKPIKNFDYWLEVLFLLNPILEKNNIKIVQVGGPNEQGLPFCHHTQGQTNWGQLAYLVKNSQLHFGSDSITQHIAGHYNIPLVDLITNNYKNCVEPFFGDKLKHIILEPNRPEGHKPNFIMDGENPKLINTIPPEKIVESVCHLLNIDYKSQYKTLEIGSNYHQRIVESANDCVIDISKLGIDNIIVRADYNYNLDNLFKQCQVSKTSIITDKPLPLEPLQQLRANITEILYKVTKEHNPDFVKAIQQIKIPCKLFSYLKEEELNPIKLYYIDAPTPIFRKDVKIPSTLKDKNLDNIFYKSSRFILGRGKIYPTFFDYMTDRSIPSFDGQPVQLLDVNLNELFIDGEFLYLMEKV
jgi:hypothetical protein